MFDVPHMIIYCVIVLRYPCWSLLVIFVFPSNIERHHNYHYWFNWISLIIHRSYWIHETGNRDIVNLRYFPQITNKYHFATSHSMPRSCDCSPYNCDKANSDVRINIVLAVKWLYLLAIFQGKIGHPDNV